MPIETYRAPQEQNQHHRRGDPERPVQIRVTLQHVEEVRARVQRRPAPLQDGGGVDVEELRVEGQRPEEALAAARGARGGHGGGQAGRGAGLAGGGGEGGVVEFEGVVLEVGVAEVALGSVRKGRQARGWGSDGSWSLPRRRRLLRHRSLRRTLYGSYTTVGVRCSVDLKA